MAKLRLEDVADAAGVSKATVSRVINRRGYLSQKTINLVERTMKELNYRPNAIAQQMTTGKTQLIGILVPNVANPFFGELASALENRLFKMGYKVLVGNAQNDAVKESRYLQQLLNHQVDALIIATHNHNVEEYQNANLPIIAIDRYLRQDIPVVQSDNYAGGKLATETLIQRGATKIIHTDNLPSNQHDTQRKVAYETTMRSHQLTPTTYLTNFYGDHTDRVNVFNQLFDEHPDVDGIFASNDTDAALLLQIAHQRGYHLPNDLQILGYDGTQASQLLAPDLATIVQPIANMANVAVDLLESRLKKQPLPASVVLPVTLREGATLRAK